MTIEEAIEKLELLKKEYGNVEIKYYDTLGGNDYWDDKYIFLEPSFEYSPIKKIIVITD